MSSPDKRAAVERDEVGLVRSLSMATDSASIAPMPGAPHESLVVLLRDHPEWLRALFEVVNQRTLPGNL